MIALVALVVESVEDKRAPDAREVCCPKGACRARQRQRRRVRIWGGMGARDQERAIVGRYEAAGTQRRPRIVDSNSERVWGARRRCGHSLGASDGCGRALDWGSVQ